VVLTVVAGQVLPLLWDEIAATTALALLALSFGTQVSWLYRHRPVAVRTRVDRQPVGAMAAR
jgi:hypothetical protein